jgi:membrane protease YdiL (CAAX protease family)
MFTILVVALFACALLFVQDFVLRSVGRSKKWRLVRWRILTAVLLGALPILGIVLLEEKFGDRRSCPRFTPTILTGDGAGPVW